MGYFDKIYIGICTLGSDTMHIMCLSVKGRMKMREKLVLMNNCLTVFLCCVSPFFDPAMKPQVHRYQVRSDREYFPCGSTHLILCLETPD